jgi:hypothetical protein
MSALLSPLNAQALTEQTLDYTIVGVIDYEGNSSSEQAKDNTIVDVVDYECNSSTIVLSLVCSDELLHSYSTTPTIV